MARSLWSGAISFGLVNVPVKLYSAVSQKEVHFNMLHEKDGGRIHQKRVCSVDGEEVPWDEIGKGYEVRRGRYVMLTKEELSALDPASSRAIEIEDFVDLPQIDPIFYDHTYYAAPDEGAERPYTLLLEAMKRTNKVAIARIVMRTKQYLCAIRPMGEGASSILALSTMNYADEIVPAKGLDLPKPAKPTARELDMAERLVESLTAAFEPDKYKDDHRERVLELLKKKAEGEELIAAEPEERKATIVNLADALAASLKNAKRPGKAPAKRGADDEHAAHHDTRGEAAEEAAPAKPKGGTHRPPKHSRKRALRRTKAGRRTRNRKR